MENSSIPQTGATTQSPLSRRTPQPESSPKPNPSAEAVQETPASIPLQRAGVGVIPSNLDGAQRSQLIQCLTPWNGNTVSIFSIHQETVEPTFPTRNLVNLPCVYCIIFKE